MMQELMAGQVRLTRNVENLSDDEGIRSNREQGNREREVDRRAERMRSLEAPYFTGDDLYGWIYRAKRYFEINQISDEEKLLAASICLEGKALNWFQ